MMDRRSDSFIHINLGFPFSEPFDNLFGQADGVGLIRLDYDPKTAWHLYLP
jgi:hypothetical protein